MKRVGIVGLGLVGGSVALALRRAFPDLEVVGVARRSETVDQALALGAVNQADTSLSLLAGSDLVVVACSLAATPAVLAELAGHIDAGTRVTDVGSVKGWVLAAARASLDLSRNPFLGGHPMAGREVVGIENADPDLFRQRPWVFTPEQGGEEPPGWEDWVDAVRAIGARPRFLAVPDHDRQVALISHVPFLLSSGYLLGVGRSDTWAGARELASSGFRDVSRLGAGDPDMYTAIIEANREQVLAAWAELRAGLDLVTGGISGRAGGLRELFEEARRTRHQWEAGETWTPSG